ncbi:hypothetical protein D9M68_857930 [compost metagenome]
MAQRGYPGIHAGMPTAQCLRSAIVVNGAPEINVHREAALEPTWFLVGPRFSCGSEPARDDGGSVNEDVGCAGLFASKLAPTRGLRCT